MAHPVKDINDRRTGRRFPLRLAVKYRSIGSSSLSDWADGESVNISSTGVLFTSREAVPPGQIIEAFVAWPVFLDKRVPLKLVLSGAIVRCAGDHTAMHFQRYEFKTCHTPSELTLKAAT
jgi:hypothetical protein